MLGDLVIGVSRLIFGVLGDGDDPDGRSTEMDPEFWTGGLIGAGAVPSC